MEQLRKTELKRFLRENKIPRKDIVLVAENIQYARNVAQLFRIADAFGVKMIYLTGISHKPPFGKDLKKVSRSKEKKILWKYYESTHNVINSLKKQEYSIVALEIADTAQSVFDFKAPKKTAIILGNEAHGITKHTLNLCDKSVYIPMLGTGASLNVSVAAAVAVSHVVRD